MKKKKKKPTQQEMLRQAREKLDLTTEELAAQLGKSLKTLRSWLEPKTSPSHRTTPESAKILLRHVLAAKKRSRPR